MVLEKFIKTYTTQVSSAWLYILILTVVLFCLMVYLERRGMARRHSTALKAFLSRGLMAVSLAGILALTLCGRGVGQPDGRPFPVLSILVLLENHYPGR